MHRCLYQQMHKTRICVVTLASLTIALLKALSLALSSPIKQQTISPFITCPGDIKPVH